MAKITFEDKNAFTGQPFNQLKAAEVNEIKASVNALYDGAGAYAVVTELPETIPPGVQLLYNGTMWRGVLEGESSLAAGTPWPVKGYKEVSIYFSAAGTVISIDRVVVNELDYTLPTTDIDIVDYESILVPAAEIPSYNVNLIFGQSISYLNNDDEVIDICDVAGTTEGITISFSSASLFGRIAIGQNIALNVKIYP
jgi:hypothetical protein